MRFRIMMFGHKTGDPLPKLRRILTKAPGQYLPRLLIFFAGVAWIKVERPPVDYSKYLGPDWTPKYEGASTLISNH